MRILRLRVVLDGSELVRDYRHEDGDDHGDHINDMITSLETITSYDNF